MTSTASFVSCSARFATPRTQRPNLAAAVARVAAELGTPLMPWQRQVLEAGTELDGGKLAYRQVCVIVPRQSGKTSLAFAVMVAYALARPRTQVAFAAQTKLDARTRMLDDWVPAISQSRFAPLVTPRRGFGSEALLFANGSKIALTSTTRVGTHGQTLDLVCVDEAWSQVDDRLEAAIRPTMVTRPDPQWWLISTAGDVTSAWLRPKVDAGRLSAQMGATETSAYFEWSAPEGADPSDPGTWRAAMPALGHTVNEAAIRADLELMPRDAFCRSYLCWWPDETGGGWETFSADAWERCRIGLQG
jgi:phage terminase large subunit-like protein